jgi:hypothetical protein
MCIATGLVGGEAFSIDASLIKADVDKKKRMPGDQPIAWPKVEEASHAVREYLAALDTARGDEDGGGDAGGSGKGGGDRRKPPKEVSLTDPQATWVARPGLDPFFAYDANYLIDNKAGIIIDAVGTRANRTVEIAITQTMVDRVERRFDLRPQRLAGDTVYGAVRLLKWLVDRNIAPHVPVWDKSALTNGTFSRAAFVFDQQRNIYICPGGAELTSTGNIDQGHIVYYRASKSDCSQCSLKPKCTTATARKSPATSTKKPRLWHRPARIAASSRVDSVNRSDKRECSPNETRKNPKSGAEIKTSRVLQRNRQHADTSRAGLGLHAGLWDSNRSNRTQEPSSGR